MESEILITDELSTIQLKQLAQLINDCNGYEPYYNCGYKHFLYYTKGTLAGFLSYIVKLLHLYIHNTDVKVY